MVSYRDEENGSIFIQIFCKVVRENVGQMSMTDMLTIVSSFCESLSPLFWTSGDSIHGFQSQGGFSLSLARFLAGVPVISRVTSHRGINDAQFNLTFKKSINANYDIGYFFNFLFKRNSMC